MVRWFLVAAFCVVFSWAGPAAATVVHFTCDDPTGCSYDEQLGESITRIPGTMQHDRCQSHTRKPTVPTSQRKRDVHICRLRRAVILHLLLHELEPHRQAPGNRLCLLLN